LSGPVGDRLADDSCTQNISAGEKGKQVKRYFNAIARQYDLMNTLLSFGIHHLWKRSAIEMLALNSGDQVIDVCGGTGDLSLLAADAVGSSGQVVLCDFSHAMMQAGRHKVKGAEYRNLIQYVQGDAESIPFPDQSFDAAMVGFGIRNVVHMEEGFKEMHRVLKSGGRLMCLEFSKPTASWFRRLYDLYSHYIIPTLGDMMAGSRQAYTHLHDSIRAFPLPDELGEILEAIGFAHVTYQRLTNGISAVHIAVKQ
jgi:demethylmenaquinone methyltransferase/2-methoxy-6-polyprenyl-1,4-benzoquinol methylase